LANGAVTTHPLGTTTAAAPGEPAGRSERVAVCMATYNSEPDLFARQVESLRRQSFTDWVCYLNDDHSDPDRIAAVRDLVEGDPRFLVERNPERLGYYRNFGRCLERVHREAEFVALCDHDDEWYPEKLATMVAAVDPATTLVYSDMRIVSRNG